MIWTISHRLDLFVAACDFPGQKFPAGAYL